MPNAEKKPAVRSKRRYIVLLSLIVLVVAGWSGAWAYGRSVLAQQIDAQLGGMARNGLQVSCADLSIAGYPFRYEVYCEGLNSLDRAGSQGSLGGVNAVALVYNPWHVIFEAKAPASMAIPLRGAAGNMTWDTARASIKFSSGALGAFDAVIDKPEAAFEDAFSSGVFEADKAEIHLRTKPDAADGVEGFVSVDDLKFLSLPEIQQSIQIRGHVQIDGGAALLAGVNLPTLVAVNDGDLPVRLVLLETSLGDSRIQANGELVVNGDGSISGSLDVTVGEAAQLLKNLEPLFPPQDNSFKLVQGIVDSLAPTAIEVDGVPSIQLPVAIDRGNVRLGFIPLGRIPPLFQVGS